jgi:hypothetical protein
MGSIFISHAAKDEALVDDLLISCVPASILPPDSVFCSTIKAWVFRLMSIFGLHQAKAPAIRRRDSPGFAALFAEPVLLG